MCGAISETPNECAKWKCLHKRGNTTMQILVHGHKIQQKVRKKYKKNNWNKWWNNRLEKFAEIYIQITIELIKQKKIKNKILLAHENAIEWQLHRIFLYLFGFRKR